MAFLSRRGEGGGASGASFFLHPLTLILESSSSSEAGTASLSSPQFDQISQNVLLENIYREAGIKMADFQCSKTAYGLSIISESDASKFLFPRVCKKISATITT